MMKKHLAKLSALLVLLTPVFAVADDAASDAPLELYFFGSRTCGQCLEIKNTMLFPLERELDGRVKVHSHETENQESFELMVRVENHFGLTAETASPQQLFLPDTFLLGFDAIMAHTRALVMQVLDDPARPRALDLEGETRDIDEVLRERFSTFTFFGILSAAAVDSVNPCAIATMIFLVSFLATQKRKRIEVLITGLSFTLAVFITYLLLGLGAFHVITALEQYYVMSQVIKWTAVSFAAVIGVISLIDGLRFKKTGDAKLIKLQLPKSVKMRIHKIITTNMAGSRLYIGAFVAGFLVTLLEAICTGQVYLPTIVLMTRSGGGELQLIGWLYLIMYNLIFVTPLLAVMIAAYYGMKWNTLSKMMQKNLTLLKILVGVVMLGLAAYLAFA